MLGPNQNKPKRGKKFASENLMKKGLFLLWGLSLTVVSTCIFYIESDAIIFSDVEEFDINNLPIGKLISIKGDVKLKAADSILWLSAFPLQNIFSGDSLSTSDGSSATISLGSEQQLQVGEKTMIGLESEKKSNQKIKKRPLYALRKIQLAPKEPVANKIKLYKGAVVANQSSNSTDNDAVSGLAALSNSLGILKKDGMKNVSQQLRIESGNKSFSLQKDSKLGLALLGAQTEPAVTAISGSIKLQNSVGSGQKTLTRKNTKLASLKNLRKKSRAIKPPKEKGSFLGDFIGKLGSVNNLNLDMFKPQIDVPKLKVPKFKPKPVDPEEPPDVEVAEEKPKPVAKAKLRDLAPKISSKLNQSFWSLNPASAGKNNIVISIKLKKPKKDYTDFRGFIELSSSGKSKKMRILAKVNKFSHTFKIPYSQLSKLISKKKLSSKIHVRVGVKNIKPKKTYITSQKGSLKFSFVSNYPSSRVTLQLSSTNWSTKKNNGWLNHGRVNSPKMTISLDNGRYLPSLFGYMASGMSFRIIPSKKIGGKNVQYLTAGAIIATSKGGSSSSIRRLSKILGADLAFKGRRADFIKLPRSKLNRIGVLEANLKKYGKLHIINRRRLILVKSDALEKDAELIKAIGYSSAGAFKSNVNLVFHAH